MKKIFIFLLSLIIAYTPALVFAGAEDLSIYDKAIRERNKIGVSNVKVKDNIVYADFKTKVNTGGSATTVNQPIKMPTTIANNAKYLANVAKNMAKGTVYSLALSGAITGILKGVDYVMDEGGQIVMKPKPENINYTVTPNAQQYYQMSGSGFGYSCTNYKATKSMILAAAEACFKKSSLAKHQFKSVRISSDKGRNVWVTLETHKNGTYEANFEQKNNPSYIPDREAYPSVPVDASQIEDAMGEWLKNNPTPLTDPVVSELYAPFTPLGSGIEGLIFPSIDYTPEIINNMLEHRNAELEAEKKRLQEPENSPDVDPSTRPSIDNPNKTETHTNPDLAPKKETITNPDGSTTVIERKIVTDEKGNQKEIITTTKTDPDGKTSVQVSEKDYKAPSTETTKLPEVCDYFSFLCEWTKWTKEKPDQDKDEEVEVVDKDFDFSVFSTSRFSVSRQCPAPIEHTLTLSGISANFSFSLTPLCDVLTLARPALVACSYLYAGYIVIGAARNG